MRPKLTRPQFTRNPPQLNYEDNGAIRETAYIGLGVSRTTAASGRYWARRGSQSSQHAYFYALARLAP